MSALQRFFTARPRREWARWIIILVGLATVPLLYAGLLTWANVDPLHTLNNVPAAIVNEDAGSTDPDLTLGEDLTKELLDTRDNNNFQWREMTLSEAHNALRDGKVYAVLVVPKSFSADAGSVAENNAASAKQAQLRIITNDSTNMISGNVASAIATEVSDTLAGDVSEEYLANMYAGFTTISNNLSEAASGAGELKDGTSTARDGSADLVVGLDDLHSGAIQLSDGAGKVAVGSKKLDAAAGELSQGANDLTTGATALKGGTADAYKGSTTLANGLDQLEEKTSALPGATEKLQAGAKALDQGAQDLTQGASTLRTGTQDLASGANNLSTGTRDALTGATGLRDGAATLAAGTPTLASGAAQLNQGLTDLQKAWPLMSDEQKLAAVTQLQQGSVPLVEGAKQTDGAAQQLAAGSADLVGTPGSKSSAPTGLNALASGADSLASGSQKVADGSDTLASGIDTLASSTPDLVTGTNTLHDGASDLAGAVTQLSDGATSLNGGLKTLDAGAGDLADGTGKLADGATQLATGAGDLTTATDQLATGTGDLASGSLAAEDGARDLNSGLGKLNDGATDLKDGLDSGKDDVPTFTDAQADQLASVSAHPVNLTKQRENEVAGYGAGLAPYFMSLSLWVGALAFFLMVNALNSRMLGSQMPSAIVALASYAPAAAMSVVQSALMVFTVHVLVGIPFAKLWTAFWISLLASLAFMAVNQALIVLLGPPGRYLALILIVLQLSAAGATYPIETTPQFFQTIHNWLPITHLVESLRTAIAGGEASFAPTIWVLSTYLVVGLVVITLGVRLKRRVRDVRLKHLEESISPRPRELSAA